MLSRRRFLAGLLAAPAVVKAASLMPVRAPLVFASPRWHTLGEPYGRSPAFFVNKNIADIIELLNQQNEILNDMKFKEYSGVPIVVSQKLPY